MHLEKAEEFLDAARLNLTAGHSNAATSDAILSGINAKDAICLKLTGRTAKSQNHNDAPEELNNAGKQARELAPILRRLIKLKSKSQYQTTSVAITQATSAVEWAGKLVAGATRIVNG